MILKSYDMEWQGLYPPLHGRGMLTARDCLVYETTLGLLRGI